MLDTNLCLRPISDLLSERFFIPAYQRGYRWTPRQVTDLLNDLLAFRKESDARPKTAFYCLQPVVVMKRDTGEWEVIDGQQRLTTLLLILTCLKPIGDAFGRGRFTINYDTRDGSREFLANIDPARAQENIDYYHIANAYATITDWFTKHKDYPPSLLQCITDPDVIGKNVKVIWYELPRETNPVEVFIRLNMGKIPLTNAELIRALFLKSSNFESDTSDAKRLQIAQEWDLIEKALQSDDFWYFIHEGDEVYPTRIEYLFKLMNAERQNRCDQTDDPLWTFVQFASHFEEDVRQTPDKWDDVKTNYMTCEEWFSDRILYHLSGFLITQGTTVTELKRLASAQVSKSEFRCELKDLIYLSIFHGEPPPNGDQATLRNTIQEELADLTYGTEEARKSIRAVLLLFNIATLLQNPTSTLRFPFDSYKKDDWDIEHIKSVKSDKPERIDDQKTWLKNVLQYWTGKDEPDAPVEDANAPQDLINQVKLALGRAHFDTAEFNRLYEPILQHFGEGKDSETDNGLANLALLDAGTNRSYKNAVFPIKRRRIIALDKSATFIPLCTTNAFLKYYSTRIDNMMFWSEEDRKDYFNAIRDTLTVFFTTDEKGGTL